jgi:hypothetical protein
MIVAIPPSPSLGAGRCNCSTPAAELLGDAGKVHVLTIVSARNAA